MQQLLAGPTITDIFCISVVMFVVCAWCICLHAVCNLSVSSICALTIIYACLYSHAVYKYTAQKIKNSCTSRISTGPVGTPAGGLALCAENAAK